MDSKTKHRILGVLVIIGIGVLAYPLLQGGNDMPSEQVLVKAPPFPEQASPLNQGPTPTVAPEPDSAPASAAPVVAPTPTALPDSSASSENVTPDDNMRQQPDDVITPSTSSTTVNVKTPDIVSPSQQPSATPSTPSTDTQDATQAAPSPTSSLEKSSEPDSVVTTQPQQKPKLSHQAKRHVKPKTVAMVKTKPAAKPFNMPRQDDSNGLLKLNQVAWVIQVGTFKQKGPAMRLVNQLRENGYRAFIQQLPSSDGNNTQVFVGPENHQRLARALATQLQDDMKVKGIVISYQPFSL